MLIITLFCLLLALVSCSASGGENSGVGTRIVLTKESITASSTNGKYSIFVVAMDPWTATTTSDWIVLNTSEGEAGTKEFQFSVLASEESAERNGTIEFKSKLYNSTTLLQVRQLSFTPDCEISPSALTFSWSGGSQEVTVAANYEYEISESADWLTIERTTNGFKAIATLNSENSTRTTTISIVGEKYNITNSIVVSQSANSMSKTSGWAEMPAMVTGDNLEYCTHDKLPSNNKLRNYSFCFDKDKHCALWVAYPLHKCYTEGSGKRTNAWGYDPCCIDDNLEPNLKNAYYPQGGSSYSHSRGHQLPSADRLASDADNATTFYYTNMTPQLQSLNGASWGALEGDLRDDYMCSDTLYVVTGAHFDSGYGYAYDNKGAGKPCAVPTHYYKVILRTKKGNSGKWVGNCSADELQCVGFWFEHKGGAARQMMSVAEIEKKTGIEFFKNVPNAPKSVYNASEW